MSLNVYLTYPSKQKEGISRDVIYIREKGQSKEVTYDECKELYPDQEPIYVSSCDIYDGHAYVFEANITHNLAQMASHAGIYNALWKPDENDMHKAQDLIKPLESGLHKLKADPEHYKQFNPSNGWGSYDGFIPWVEKYLAACREYHDADVRVSR